MGAFEKVYQLPQTMKGCLLVAGNLVEAGLYQIAYFCVGFMLCKSALRCAVLLLTLSKQD